LAVERARFVGFTPDSQDLVFISPGYDDHVERWRVTDRSRVEFTKISLLACESAGLSPDGRVLVCVDKNGTLTMTEVASGKTFLDLRNFDVQRYSFVGNTIETVPAGRPGLVSICFSPDGNFVLLVTNLRTAAWNLRNGTTVELHGPLKNIQLKERAFVAPDRVLLSDLFRAKNGIAPAELVEFPSGRALTKLKVPRNGLDAATGLGFVLVRPFGQSSRAAAVDLTTGKVIISDTLALDVWSQFYVAEPSPGKMGLYEIGKGLQATVVLSKG
jgi:hypothetical protein